MARILITDDTAFMRNQLKDIFIQLGHEVVGEAENGLVSIKKYQELKPDIVTMDITMPQMNGVDAVKEIKKLDAKAKVIVCSAMGQKATMAKAIQAGAKDFIMKPFTADRVEDVIKKQLQAL